MCDHCSGEIMIDAAIAEGRIHASARETVVRTYEASPDLVVDILAAAKPDHVIATRNYVAAVPDEEHEAYRADASQRFGIPVAEVL